MTKELLKTLLDYSFYEKYKHKIDEDLFNDAVTKELFNTLEKHYTDSADSITLHELKALYLASNPTVTTARKKSLELLFDELDTINLSASVQESILKKAINQHKWNEIALLAIEGAENKDVDSLKIQKLLEDINSDGAEDDEDEYVTTDLKELLAISEETYKWKFHLEALQNVIGGIGPGVFGIIAARPNAGKTAFITSLTFSPGGWLTQGARVHMIGNEERVARTVERGFSAFTGIPKIEFEEKLEYVQQLMNPLRKHIFYKDNVTMTFKELEGYIKRKKDKIDILIIDQLDKIRMSGTYTRGDERLRDLYTNTRELAKKYNIAIIGICQASADAEGKMYYGFECLDGSKTGKAAEVDLCITIGKAGFSQTGDDGFRIANICKNKLKGLETYVSYMLNHNLSRIQA